MSAAAPSSSLSNTLHKSLKVSLDKEGRLITRPKDLLLHLSPLVVASNILLVLYIPQDRVSVLSELEDTILNTLWYETLLYHDDDKQ